MEYISLAIAFLGAFSGFTLAQYANNFSEEVKNKNNTLGILKATEFSTTNALQEVETHIEVAEAARKLEKEGKKRLISPSPITMRLPNTLEILQREGVMFLQLSHQFQANLPSFIRYSRIYEEALEKFGKEKFQTGTLANIKDELEVQLLCIKIEIQRLNNQINDSDFNEQFHAALGQRYQKLLTRANQ